MNNFTIAPVPDLPDITPALPAFNIYVEPEFIGILAVNAQGMSLLWTMFGAYFILMEPDVAAKFLSDVAEVTTNNLPN